MKQSKQIFLTLMITVALVGLSWYAGHTRTKERMVSVVMASDSIQAGQVISSEQLTTVDLPADRVSNAWVTSLEEAVNTYAVVDFVPGELLLRKRLSAGPSGLDYPNAGNDRRLMTIALNPSDANGFWLTDGSCIDLYLILRHDPTQQTMTVMKSIRIVKVILPDSDFNSSQSTIRSPLLCLDLSVAQADQLALAMENCILRIAAVNEERKPPDF